MSLKNYSVLNSMSESPQVVANFLKKVLQEMSEPLIPFANYPDFRDLLAPGDLERDEEDELFSNTLELLEQTNAPIDKRNARINEIHTLVDQLPPINRNTLQYLCKFFERVTAHSTVNLVTSTRIAALMILAIFRA